MSFNFGNPFGTNPTTTTASFNFGQTPKTTSSFSGFSFTTPATQPTTPGFNLGAQTSTTSTGFGLGTTSTASPGFGSFGNTFGTQSTPGFGTSGFSGFGTTIPTTTTGFSFFGSPNTTTSAPPMIGFGQTQTTQPTGFGGFGAKQIGFGGFGTQLGQTTIPQQQNQEEVAFYNSLFNVTYFGDERDEILRNWNILQATWGTGQGFYARNSPPIIYNQKNPLCKFKSVGYSRKPPYNAKDGIVALKFKKKAEDIINQEAQCLQSLGDLFNKQQNPNIFLEIVSIKPVPSDQTIPQEQQIPHSIVLIYVEEKSPTGTLKRIGSAQLTNYLIQQKQQALRTMEVVDVFPYILPDMDDIQEYLEKPQEGIEERIWKDAVKSNPNPDIFLPVPIIGIDGLCWHMQCQTNENKNHEKYLELIANEVDRLTKVNDETKAKVLEYKNKIVELEHRLLQAVINQETNRNIGVALRPEEEVLGSQLDTIHSQLSSPQIQGRLSELLSQIRIHKQQACQQDFDNYTMSPEVQEELKLILNMQQIGIKTLIDVMHSDMETLGKIKNDLEDLHKVETK